MVGPNSPKQLSLKIKEDGHNKIQFKLKIKIKEEDGLPKTKEETTEEEAEEVEVAGETAAGIKITTVTKTTTSKASTEVVITSLKSLLCRRPNKLI